MVQLVQEDLSVKASGNFFGWQVLVFNCDEVSTS